MRNLIWFTLFFLIGCSNSDTTNGDDNEVKDLKNNKPLVSILELKKKPFKDFFYTQGHVISKKMAYVRPEINGTVIKILVEEGDYVKQGVPLFSISNELFNSQILELNEQVSFAEY